MIRLIITHKCTNVRSFFILSYPLCLIIWLTCCHLQFTEVTLLIVWPLKCMCFKHLPLSHHLEGQMYGPESFVALRLNLATCFWDGFPSINSLVFSDTIQPVIKTTPTLFPGPKFQDGFKCMLTHTWNLCVSDSSTLISWGVCLDIKLQIHSYISMLFEGKNMEVSQQKSSQR